MDKRSGAAVRAQGFGWRHAGRKKHALNDVSFDVQPGEKVLLLGESGAGKSTLLAAIAGVLGGADEGDWSGQLSVDGLDCRDTDSLRGTVGLLLQDPDSQVIATKVGDDVAFGCENLGVPREEIWRRVPEALELVGLHLPLEHPTAKLSGGQKQRLALAGIIAMGARVIVLDEPTANVDPEGVRDIVAAVSHVAEQTGATLIVVEHRVDVWRNVTERAIVLGSAGDVQADGPLDDLMRREADSLASKGIWVPEWLLSPRLQLAHVVKAGRAGVDKHWALRSDQLQTGWDAETPVGPVRTMEIPAATSTVITGRNGAGKTTLALTLAGLLPALSGGVRAHAEIARGAGVDPHDWSSVQLAQRIGFVFQDPEHQFLARTVREELLIAPAVAARSQRNKWWPSVGWREHVSAEDEKRADELLSALRLENLAAASPFSLSGGQKRRLSVATSLISSPSVVFLDEPTFGQDRSTFMEIIMLLRQLQESGVTMISITHDPLYVELFGQHHVLLESEEVA